MYRLAVFLLSSLIAAVPTPEAAAGTVNLVYLSPSDRPYRDDYAMAIERAVADLDAWLSGRLGGYALNDAGVFWHEMPNTASYYRTGTSGALQFWDNALQDAFALTGGRFDDPENAWIFYVDADPLPGQIVGGTSGVAMLPANDLRGLAGEALVPIDPDDSTLNPGFDRWVGGLGHELGHALGLPHPPGSPGGVYDDSLMYYGYLTFPETYLRPIETAGLLGSGFFSEPAPIPVPASAWLLISGLSLIGGFARLEAAARRVMRP